MYVLMLLPNIVALIAIAQAGQGVHNNAAAITRALAHLLIVTNAGYTITLLICSHLIHAGS